MVEKYMPDIYQKSIYYINYDKLYKKGIRCLLFDLDNTITPCNVDIPTKRLKKLFDELKDKGFKIVIVSNATKRRIEPFKNELNVDACALSLKTKMNKYQRILDKLKYKPSEIAAIGDSLKNDIYLANKLDITSVLVNPLTDQDNSINLINRFIERYIFNGLSKKELFMKGKYYD